MLAAKRSLLGALRAQGPDTLDEAEAMLSVQRRTIGAWCGELRIMAMINDSLPRCAWCEGDRAPGESCACSVPAPGVPAETP